MPAAGRAAIVFAAAPLAATPRLRARLADLNQAYVVAADRGAATALAFGFTPDLVVGDLDSLDAATLAQVEQRHIALATYPRDKDATDGELALAAAQAVHPDAVWLLGFLGGPRLDQAVASLLLAGALNVPVVLLDAANEATFARPSTPVEWRAEPDEIISLVPLGGDVQGVTTAGLRWPLAAATLHLGGTRGVSNAPIAGHVRVSVAEGLLLVTRHFPRAMADC